MNVCEAVDKWVSLWNTYDLNQVTRIFINDPRVTYFSSEKEGRIKGIDNLIAHHKEFGFVSGGRNSGNRLWLENVDIEEYRGTAVVTADWCFQRRGSEETQRGPVTLLFIKIDDGWRIAHAHFSNYKKT
ncbi:hypothetical protein DRO42_05905 [Candidatus Bathyarchaeota archaeon]|nr:MAG: hypothetical protein DRO42_05905 [Candidatus Bathyarchaeota archaeon]